MQTKKTPEEIVNIAKGWRASGQRQEEYARQHGISGRTLRKYLKKHVVAVRKSDVIAVLDQAIAALHALRSKCADEVTEQVAASDATPNMNEMQAEPMRQLAIPSSRRSGFFALTTSSKSG